MAESLVYIPDISGFTAFVNNTEINHAQHIISELLELIIDNNTLEMEVAEIEGDAVLFYKHNSIPEASEIIKQSEKIFIAFHEHLLRYESERLCQCGACSTAYKLTLKMIAHTGEIGFTKVKDHSKPFGPTLVEAHRLLKNDIDDDEYLLMTDHYKASVDPSHIKDSLPWVTINEGKGKVDLSTIEYAYIPLSPLHTRIEAPKPAPPPPKSDNPVSTEVVIEKPVHFVFEMVTNLDFRLSWNKGIDKLIYEQDKTNRVGTKHRCLFGNGFADFETITNDFGPDSMVYGEKIENPPPLLRDISIYYVLNEGNGNTHLKVEFHFHTKPLGWLFTPLIRMRGRSNMLKAAKAIKEVCESTNDLTYHNG
jgi:hypothetical protein